MAWPVMMQRLMSLVWIVAGRYCRDPSGGSVGLRHAEGGEQADRASAKAQKLAAIELTVADQLVPPWSN